LPLGPQNTADLFQKKAEPGVAPRRPYHENGEARIVRTAAGGLPHASISRCIAQVVPTAPPYAISWAPFRAGLAPHGFTIKQIHGGLNQMRNVNGFLAPADRSLKGLVRWSADSIEKFQRGETLRDEFGAVVWSPDLSVVKANAEAPAETPRREDLPARADHQSQAADAGSAPPQNEADRDGYDLFRDQPLAAAVDRLDELLATAKSSGDTRNGWRSVIPASGLKSRRIFRGKGKGFEQVREA
jgi:hypothetical protein